MTLNTKLLLLLCPAHSSRELPRLPSPQCTHKQQDLHHYLARILGRLVLVASIMDKVNQFLLSRWEYHAPSHISSSDPNFSTGSHNSGLDRGGHVQLLSSRFGLLLCRQQLPFVTFVRAMFPLVPSQAVQILWWRAVVVVGLASMSLRDLPPIHWGLDLQTKLVSFGHSCWTFFRIKPNKWILFWGIISWFTVLMNCAYESLKLSSCNWPRCFWLVVYG